MAITYAGFTGSVDFASADFSTTTSEIKQNIPVLLSTTTTKTQQPYRELTQTVCTGTTPRNNVNATPTTITHPWHWLTQTCSYTYTNGTTTTFTFSTTTTATTSLFTLSTSSEVYDPLTIEFPATTTVQTQNDQLMNFALLLLILIAVLFTTIHLLRPLYVRK